MDGSIIHKGPALENPNVHRLAIASLNRPHHGALLHGKKEESSGKGHNRDEFQKPTTGKKPHAKATHGTMLLRRKVQKRSIYRHREQSRVCSGQEGEQRCPHARAAGAQREGDVPNPDRGDGGITPPLE